MALSSSPAVLQEAIVGITDVDNADGTTAKTIYAAGPDGVFLESLTVASGPTTAPGGTYTCLITINDGGANTATIKVITLTNTVDTIQFEGYLGINLAAAAELRIQMRTTLASGATLTAIMTGRGY